MVKPVGLSAAGPPSSLPTSRPEVIVDFTVEDGLLTIHLKNVGDRSAYLVKTSFSQPFHGVAAKKPVPAMRVFRKVDFMPPGKDFAHFVDSLAGYVKRKQPRQVVATVAYRDRDGNRFEGRYSHDLRIYLELRTATLARPRPQGD